MVNDAYQSFESCLEEHFKEKLPNGKIDNMFKYVIPESIYIKNSMTGNRVAGLMCKCKFDLENGLAAKFVNEKLVEVGQQQIVL